MTLQPSQHKFFELIRADHESIHKYFAGVAALCHEVGITNLNIGYVFDKPKE